MTNMTKTKTKTRTTTKQDDEDEDGYEDDKYEGATPQQAPTESFKS